MPEILEPPVVGDIDLESSTDSELDLQTPWLVVVYDDPVNTMAYVTMVFEKVLALPRAEAERKMWEVHTKGRSIVWEGGREKAETLTQQIHLYGLQSRLERAD